MVDTIDFDNIVGVREPILKVAIKGKVFDIYPLDKMSEEVTIRVLKANVQFEAANEAFQRRILEIDAEIEGLLAESEKPKTSKTEKVLLQATISNLNSQKTLEQTMLVVPARVLIESMAGMPSGTLSQSSPQAVNQLFEKVVEVVFPKQKEIPVEPPQQNSKNNSTTDSKLLSEVSQSSPVMATSGKKL